MKYKNVNNSLIYFSSNSLLHMYMYVPLGIVDQGKLRLCVATHKRYSDTDSGGVLFLGL